MTTDQLRAHMDRRFDRLERTKADRSKLRRLAFTADRRGAATKRAFKRFATKDDLKGFVRKADLKRFATKVDFARLEDRVISMQRTLEGIARHHGLIFDDHEVRIRDLERRR